MKSKILLILLLACGISVFAKTRPAINVMINDTVSFETLLIPGTSSKPFEKYAGSASQRSSQYVFNCANVGNVKHCRYYVVCESGKIVSINIFAKDTNAFAYLKAMADSNFGQTEKETSTIEKGAVKSACYQYNANGQKAKLVRDKETVILEII